MIQLNPPLPVVTPLGPGLAHVLLDYGIEHNLMWVVFLDDTGECWTFDNSDIRAEKNLTYGRDNPDKPTRKIDWKKGES